jgi:predicted DNA binding protein
MLEAELSITVPRDWRHDIIRDHEATFTSIECLGASEQGCQSLVDIAVAPARAGAASEAIRRHPSVLEADLDVLEGGRVRGRVATRECTLCSTAVGDLAFVLGTRMGPDGRLVQRLLVEDQAAVRAVVARFRAAGRQVELLSLGRLEGRDYLTSRQEDVLYTAYDLGYFDDPKGVSLRDLARRFGVSVSTVSEALRGATRKLMGRYFEARGDGV